MIALLIIGQKNTILSGTKNLLNYHWNLFHTKIKADKRIGPHNSDVISVIVGSLLGDCYGSRRSVEGTRFVYKQSIVHKEYFFWLYEFFYSRGYCSKLEPRKYTRKIAKVSQKREYFGYEFNTYTFRSFNWIYEMFYKDGKKRVSLKLENYLTPLALAIWIMDDGYWTGYGVRISTNSFELEEVQFLAVLLTKLFNLNCTVQKIQTVGQYSVNIKTESIPDLRKLIIAFTHESMYYKLGL